MNQSNPDLKYKDRSSSPHSRCAETTRNQWCLSLMVLVVLLGDGARCFHLPQQPRPLSGRRTSSASAGKFNRQDPLRASTFADSALKRVEWLGGLVSVSARDRQEGEGMGGTVYDGVSLAQLTGKVEESKSKQVWAALATLERDSTFVL